MNSEIGGNKKTVLPEQRSYFYTHFKDWFVVLSLGSGCIRVLVGQFLRYLSIKMLIAALKSVRLFPRA